MSAMNWHSVGIKVVVITMSVFSIMAIILVILYANNEKQKVFDTSLKSAKQLLLVSESVRYSTIEKWKLGVFSTEFLNQLIENKTPDSAKSLIIATVPVANAWNVNPCRQKSDVIDSASVTVRSICAGLKSGGIISPRYANIQ